MSNLAKAISITAQAFEDKFDKGGRPYFMHCYHVMDKLKYDAPEDVLCAAVMHDLVEDTSWTLEGLRAEGFSQMTLELVDALTHKEDDGYQDYIFDVIDAGHWAMRIKLEDLHHNSDLRRIKGRREKDFARVRKYQEGYLQIMEAMNAFS